MTPIILQLLKHQPGAGLVACNVAIYKLGRVFCFLRSQQPFFQSPS